MKLMVPLLAVASLVAAQTGPTEVIIAELKKNINATSILTKAILSFESAAQALDLLNANTNALSQVRNSTKVVLGLNEQVPLDQSLQLPPPTIQLSNLVNQSITAIISKKSTFVNNGLGGITYTSLQDLNCASQQFSNATASRLPGGGIGLVTDELTAPIYAAFKQGLEAYRPNGTTNDTYDCAFVNGTSRGLAAVDQSGAALLTTSNGLTLAVAAVLSGFLMI